MKLEHLFAKLFKVILTLKINKKFGIELGKFKDR
jgi:hypothetical protein